MALVDKYRPKNLDEIFGQEHAVRIMKDMAKREFKEIPNLLFYGPPGSGKSAMAKSFVRSRYGKEWRAHWKELNASDDRGIKTVRDEIKRHAKTLSEKIIFLDEFDAMTKDAQHALRVIMESHETTLFILSCNYPWKIIPAIKSRCSNIFFGRHNEDTTLKFLKHIIKLEGIKVKKSEKKDAVKAIKYLANRCKGDLRKALQTLEQIITSEKSMNLHNIMILDSKGSGKNIFETALSGNYGGALNLLEDYLIQTQYNWFDLIEEISSEINNITDEEVALKIVYDLAETEHRLVMGSDPRIQLAKFIAVVTASSHYFK